MSRVNLDDLRFAEDFHVDQVVEFGTYDVTEAEVLAFAEQWDPQWFHVDVEAAAAGPYGGLIASGLQTLAIYQRLNILAVKWAAIAGRSIRDIHFLRPVRPGDQLTGSLLVEQITPEPERNRALVVTAGQLSNAEGKQVLTLKVDAYLHLSRAAMTA